MMLKLLQEHQVLAYDQHLRPRNRSYWIKAAPPNKRRLSQHSQANCGALS